MPSDSEDIGKVGSGYCAGFMRRNSSSIVNRWGQKYKLDRASWTVYRNFKDMHTRDYREMEVAGVAKILIRPSGRPRKGRSTKNPACMGVTSHTS